MGPILELVKKRGAVLYTLPPEATVFEALGELAKHNVGAMMVMEGGKLTGVFSERDYTRKIALQGKSSKDTLVRDIMTTKVLVVTPQTPIRDCMALMIQNNIRHLPVLEGDKVWGMISIRDIMKDIIDQHELTISQLHSYINS